MTSIIELYFSVLKMSRLFAAKPDTKEIDMTEIINA